MALGAVAAAVWLAACASASPEVRAGRLGAVEEGMATYYAARLAGHRTANGERYDPRAMTAAHHALPLGTVVRVVRLDPPGHSVQVRINDRCAGRRKIIDLSEAAARRLDMMRAGIVRVRLQVVRSPSPRSSLEPRDARGSRHSRNAKHAKYAKRATPQLD